MGIAIKIKGATFTNYIDTVEFEDDPIIPDAPVTINDYPVKNSTLKGLYDLGGAAEDSIVDHSGNNNDGTANGDIVYSNGYATFSGNGVSSNISTPITTDPNNKTTIVALFRVPTGMRSIVSNFKDYPDCGAILGADRVFTYKNGETYLKLTYPTALNSSNFVLVALTISNTHARAVKEAAGSLVELGYAEENITNWTLPFVIGGYHSNVSWNDTADISLVAIHEGDITDAQLGEIFAFARKYGVEKGLTID